MTYKTKEQTMKTYQADFPWTENKEILCFTWSVSGTRSFDWNLESINICTNCQFIWSGKVYIWLPVWEFKKTMPLATMSQQAHACWSRIEILITFNITFMWTFHTNSLLHEYIRDCAIIIWRGAELSSKNLDRRAEKKIKEQEIERFK